MSEDYRITQSRMDREFKAAWDALPPQDRAELEAKMSANREYPVLKTRGKVVHETSHAEAAQGLKESVGRREDAGALAEHHADFREVPDMATAVDHVPDVVRELWTQGGAVAVAKWHEAQMMEVAARQAASVLGRIVGFFLLPGNLRLRAHGLAHAGRMAKRNGLGSLRDSADACGVTPTAMCNVAWKCVEILGLPPLENAKSEAAKASYRKDKNTNHWRKQKCNAMKPKQQQRKQRQAA